MSEAVIADVPQVDSVDMSQLKDSEADVAVTSELTLEPETLETPMDFTQWEEAGVGPAGGVLSIIFNIMRSSFDLRLTLSLL